MEATEVLIKDENFNESEDSYICAEKITQEFLEYVIPKSDVRKISKELMKKFGTFYNACNAPLSKLMEIEGISEQTAKQMKYFPTLVRAYRMSFFSHKKKFRTKDEIAGFCVELLAGRRNEHFYMLCFNSKNELIGRIHLAEGTPNQVYVQSRQIIEKVINTLTKKVVLAHNHPGGMLVPSFSDVDMTTNIKQALEVIGVELTEHIIVGKYNYVFIAIE